MYAQKDAATNPNDAKDKREGIEETEVDPISLITVKIT